MTWADCEPLTYPCWDQYGDHQKGFVAQATIDLSLSTMSLRARHAALTGEGEDIQKAIDAANSAYGLINARWGYCNRNPFAFAPLDEDAKTTGESDLLKRLGLAKRPEPLKRRV